MDLAPQEMLPHAEKWDEEEIFPEDTLRKLAELGFAGTARLLPLLRLGSSQYECTPLRAGIYIKDDIGGSGLSRQDAAIVFEVRVFYRVSCVVCRVACCVCCLQLSEQSMAAQ
jgi:hypothetical protein